MNREASSFPANRVIKNETDCQENSEGEEVMDVGRGEWVIGINF